MASHTKSETQSVTSWISVKPFSTSSNEEGKIQNESNSDSKSKHEAYRQENLSDREGNYQGLDNTAGNSTILCSFYSSAYTI